LTIPPGLALSSRSFRVYRIVLGKVDPLLTERNRENGGRYNPAGEFGALYTSLGPTTAREEVRKGLQKEVGLRRRKPSPRLYKLAVQKVRVLDLTDSEVLARLGWQHASLVRTDVRAWENTQELGRAARNAGCEAILAPSAARPGFKNLIIFEGIGLSKVTIKLRP
jgi:RES domain-containing protein